MAWNERCSQKALGKSLFCYYRKALAAVSLNNWINVHLADASSFDSAVYSSVADKLYSMELILVQVRFLGDGTKARLFLPAVRDPSAGGPKDFPSVVLRGGQTGSGSSCTGCGMDISTAVLMKSQFLSLPCTVQCWIQISIGMLSLMPWAVWALQWNLILKAFKRSRLPYLDNLELLLLFSGDGS